MTAHGTTTGYNRDGCRCALCREAHREYMRWYRKRKRGQEVMDRAADQRDAYRAAEGRLREAHRAEFDAIYAEERAARGLPSVVAS